MRMEFDRKLPIPMEVKALYPASESVQETVRVRTNVIMKILDGRDNRLLLILGPCSADNEDTVLEYISKLKDVQEYCKDKILIVPRVYTEKPRSSCNDYKGLLHQPDPRANPDLFEGIIATRRIHMRVIQETGFGSADEMLYTESYKYIDDILTYSAVGARSVEDQQHRLTASAAECPVGMKNPTNGNLRSLVMAVKDAQTPHDFIYRGWAGVSMGNPYAHAILRGFVNERGKNYTNYDYQHILYYKDLCEKYKIQNPGVIIDCNHCNSNKDPLEQSRIANTILQYRNSLESIGTFIKGLMIESYIYGGRQDIREEYILGKSITDPCLDLGRTYELISIIYNNLGG